MNMLDANVLLSAVTDDPVHHEGNRLAAADALETARRQIGIVFAQPASNSKKDKVTAGTILKSLERILGSPRSGWNGPLLRALWPALEDPTGSLRCSENRGLMLV